MSSTTTTLPSSTRSAAEAHAALTARAGFGRMGAAQIRAAGISWAEIHAMTDAGLLRYVDAVSHGAGDRVCTIWMVMFG